MKKTRSFKIFISLMVTVGAPIIILASDAGSTGKTFKIENRTPIRSAPLEDLRLITSTGIERFVADLNDNGKLGYRLESSLSYGGEGPTQSYAAVVRLDAPNKYEYDWISSPDKKLLEPRLNFQAKKGFNFVNAYALTHCSGGTSEEQANPTSPESLIFRLQKGDAFLLERMNGDTGQQGNTKSSSPKCVSAIVLRKLSRRDLMPRRHKVFDPSRFYSRGKDCSILVSLFWLKGI